MDAQSEDIKNELIKVTKAVREKYKNLKKGILNENMFLEKTFQPITTAIEKNTAIKEPILNKGSTNVLMKERDEDELNFDTASEASGGVHFRAGDKWSTPDNSLAQDNEESNEILNDFLKSVDGGKFDKLYGVKVGVNGDFLLGRNKIKFHKNQLHIKNKRYPLSEGLLNLLFLRDPQNYSRKEAKIYKELLKTTKLLKPSKGNSVKYKTIVRKLISPSKTGRGNWLHSNQPSINYFQSIDDLINRLRILIHSQLAGNTGVNNEVQAIVSKLKELNVIY